MKDYIPPFILILIGIGFYYYQSPGVVKSSEDTRTDDKPLVKKNLESVESVDKPIDSDPFPSRYLSNWNTDDGPMKLMQGPDMWVKGFYYFDNQEVKGRVTTRYIQKDNRKKLSGYWVQDESPQRCDYSRHGSYYWGMLTFDFQGDSFTGKWGFCDDKPQSNWNGKLTNTNLT